MPNSLILTISSNGVELSSMEGRTLVMLLDATLTLHLQVWEPTWNGVIFAVELAIVLLSRQQLDLKPVFPRLAKFAFEREKSFSSRMDLGTGEAVWRVHWRNKRSREELTGRRILFVVNKLTLAAFRCLPIPLIHQTSSILPKVTPVSQATDPANEQSPFISHPMNLPYQTSHRVHLTDLSYQTSCRVLSVSEWV